MSSSRTEKHNKGSYRRKRMALMIMVGFIVWGGITIWDEMDKRQVKATQLEKLIMKLEQSQLMNDRLHHEVSRLNDDEYIEQKIRTELHYAKPEETIFFVPR